MRGRVGLEVREGPAAAGSPLIEKNDARGFEIKKAPVELAAAPAGPAVQKKDRHATRAPAHLVEQLMPVGHAKICHSPQATAPRGECQFGQGLVPAGNWANFAEPRHVTIERDWPRGTECSFS